MCKNILPFESIFRSPANVPETTFNGDKTLKYSREYKRLEHLHIWKKKWLGLLNISNYVSYCTRRQVHDTKGICLSLTHIACAVVGQK